MKQTENRDIITIDDLIPLDTSIKKNTPSNIVLNPSGVVLSRTFVEKLPKDTMYYVFCDSKKLPEGKLMLGFYPTLDVIHDTLRPFARELPTPNSMGAINLPGKNVMRHFPNPVKTILWEEGATVIPLDNIGFYILTLPSNKLIGTITA